jgi:hypothetical protein
VSARAAGSAASMIPNASIVVVKWFKVSSLRLSRYREDTRKGARME